jgi:hypothetical protein
VPAATNVSSADAASTIMTNHHTVSVSTYCGVTYKVLRMVIEANCSHIFRGCWVLLREYATRHHGFDQPGFNQGLRDTRSTLDRPINTVLHAARRIADDVHALGRRSFYSSMQGAFLHRQDQNIRLGVALRMACAISWMSRHNANLMMTSFHKMARVPMASAHDPRVVSVIAIQTIDFPARKWIEVMARIIGSPLRRGW